MAIYAESQVEWLLPADGYFDPAYFDPAYFDMSHEWASVAADVRAQQAITCSYGIQGNTPADRVASTGTLKFALNNSEYNSAHRLGYYSLQHPLSIRRAGFELNTGVRWRVRCPQVIVGLPAYRDQVLSLNPLYDWRLDDSGATATDSVGGATGTILGGVTRGTESAVSGGGTSMTFDGSSGRISIASAPIPLAATIAIWAKTTSGAFMNMFSPPDGGAGQLALVLGQNSGLKAGLYTGSLLWGNRPIGSPNGDGLWHHYVFVLNPPFVAIYVDGTLDITGPNSRTAPSAGALWMGSALGTSQFFNGALDHVTVFPYVLTTPQIAALYAARNVTTVPWYCKFVGTLDEAVPDPGIYGTRLTFCTAVDLWDDYAVTDTPDLALQTNKRFDELIKTLLDVAPTQPRQRVIETGSDTYAYAFDGGTGQRVKIRERLDQLAASEFGYVYTRGNDTTGGVLVAENRQHRTANPPVNVNVENTMDRDGVAVPGARRDIYARVRLMVHPTNDVSVASVITLWSLQQTDTVINAGETNSYIFGAYFDPVSHQEIGGAEVAVPVAYADFTMNTARDGTGTDMTGVFAVSASRTGLGVRWTLTNFGAVAAYVTKLQVRGKPIYRTDAFAETAVPGAYGDQILELDMPLQNSINAAANVAGYLADRYSKPFANAPSVRFLANRSLDLMTAALQLEPGDRVAVGEALTGLRAEFTINAVTLEFAAGGLLWCTWGLEAATAQDYWLIGIVGVSELGTTTYLGV